MQPLFFEPKKNMNNTEIVLAFIDAWNNMDWDGAAGLLTDDIIWHNIPMAKVEGKAAVDQAIRGMSPESVDWQVISIAENRNQVLTERIDRFDMSGKKKIDLPVMGTFEITDGKISAWRDYFDLRTLTSQMS